tara:strand:+ start:842 stop:1240 length:399 start_codon:yes stop_codon:yes gene_type:complete
MKDIVIANQDNLDLSKAYFTLLTSLADFIASLLPVMDTRINEFGVASSVRSQLKALGQEVGFDEYPDCFRDICPRCGGNVELDGEGGLWEQLSCVGELPSAFIYMMPEEQAEFSELTNRGCGWGYEWTNPKC